MTPTCADCARPGQLVRGLCSTCYDGHRLSNTLACYPRRNWPADELLDEWVRLRDDGSSVTDAAARLGVSFEALRRAMYRAAARGDHRGRRAPFGRALTASTTHTPPTESS